MKLYGSKVFVRVPESKRYSKWDRKAELGILIGYDVVGYRVLIGNRVIVARHVDVIEEDVKCIGLDDSDLENESLNENFDKENENLELNENINKNGNVVNEVRRSQRTITKPSRFDDNFVYSGCIYMLIIVVQIVL